MRSNRNWQIQACYKSDFKRTLSSLKENEEGETALSLDGEKVVFPEPFGGRQRLVGEVPEFAHCFHRDGKARLTIDHDSADVDLH